MSTSLRQDVVVRDVEMSFGSMVVFMIKWTIASIPAFLFLFMLFVLFAAVAGGFFAGLTEAGGSF